VPETFFNFRPPGRKWGGETAIPTAGLAARRISRYSIVLRRGVWRETVINQVGCEARLAGGGKRGLLPSFKDLPGERWICLRGSLLERRAGGRKIGS